MVEKVPHDQVIQVVLVCMVAFIENYQCDFLHLDEAVHQQVIKFLCHRDENVVLCELLTPSV